MKHFIFIITAIIFASCSQLSKTPKEKKQVDIQSTIENNDSTEYELIIFDTKFDSFLATQPPKTFYGVNYYKSWNLQYVTEWNIRHNNPLKYGDFYETHIDYQPNIDYGLDLNYQLYYYFLFIEKEYNIKLINRSN